MKHPALDALYELVPAFNHQALDMWATKWITCYRASSITEGIQITDTTLLDGEIKRTKWAAADKAFQSCDIRVDVVEAPEHGPTKVVVTSSCFVLSSGKSGGVKP